MHPCQATSRGKAVRFLILIVVLLAGCATEQAPEQNTGPDSWYGARYETVAAQWGAPTRSSVLAGNRDSHTWMTDTYVYTSPSWFPSTIGVFGSNRGVGVGTAVATGPRGNSYARCERTMIFKNGQVSEQSWQGHRAYCNSFRRYYATETQPSPSGPQTR